MKYDGQIGPVALDGRSWIRYSQPLDPNAREKDGARSSSLIKCKIRDISCISHSPPLATLLEFAECTYLPAVSNSYLLPCGNENRRYETTRANGNGEECCMYVTSSLSILFFSIGSTELKSFSAVNVKNFSPSRRCVIKDESENTIKKF